MLGLFTLGMGMPGANEKGSVTGLFSGVVISMWIGFGGPKPPPPVRALMNFHAQLIVIKIIFLVSRIFN